MEQVLDVYKAPPYSSDFPVVCMDESPRQLIKETHLPIPMAAGSEQMQDYEYDYDYDYERCGVANVFMTAEPLTGKRFISITERKTKKEWAEFVNHIADELYPDAVKIRLVMDNVATHKAAALYDRFQPGEAKRLWGRFEFIYTPKHRSWLNMAEIELNILASQCLNKRIGDIHTLRKEVTAWAEHRNNRNWHINWQFTNDQDRIKLKRLYPTFIASRNNRISSMLFHLAKSIPNTKSE